MLTLNFEDAKERWDQVIDQLIKHIYRKQVPAEELNRIKSELKEGETIVQCDYSDSNKNTEQDEIQSTYFGHSCFTIFTVCSY